jgi:serine/threonine protein kinase
MTPEDRERRLDEIYNAALERDAGQRAGFVRGACGEDEELRREVESLLGYEGKAGDFLEKPALEAAAQSIAEGQEPSLLGRKLGPYNVVSLLGVGGMGEVYQARDTRLGRLVALKILPSDLATDPRRKRRFLQEAKAASALNHPNIVTLHDVGCDSGIDYLVMEYVRGKTLDQLIPREGLDFKQALRYATEIAGALVTAHAGGIIHRDLKPGNIMINEGGTVKVMDFGLAKVEEAAAGQTAVTRTETGVIIGTAAYMSPEQARGEDEDARSDIFSFGVVLYEMLSGQRPFQGRDRVSILAAIVQQEPPPLTGIPQDLDKLVLRCLGKDPARRFQHMADVKAALERLRVESDSGKLMSARPARRRFGDALRMWVRYPSIAVGIAALALLVLLLTLRWNSREPRHEAVQRELIANLPENPVGRAVISPDGRYLAYSDQSGISLLQIDTGETRSFPAAVTPLSPVSWFPDGSHLLLLAEGSPSQLWKMSTWDGTTRKLLDEGYIGLVSPDGGHIAFVKDELFQKIWLAGADGGEPHVILSTDHGDSLMNFDWSPAGKRIVYLRHHHDANYWGNLEAIETCNLEGGQRTVVLSDQRLFGENGTSDVAWLSDGRIVFALTESSPNDADRNIWSIQVDPQTGAVRGKATRLTSWIGFELSHFSPSADGKRLVLKKLHSQHMVKTAELGRDKNYLRSPRRLTLDTWRNNAKAWTPDNRSVIFQSRRERDGIFKQGVTERRAEALVTGKENYRYPVVSPDGHWLLFTASPSPSYDASSSRLMRMPIEGGAQTVVLPGLYSYHCASAPSQVCVLAESKRTETVFAFLDPIKGRGLDLAKTSSVTNWSLSPDGKSIAWIDNSGQIQIIDLTTNARRDATPRDWFIQSISWSADGNRLYATGYTTVSPFSLLSLDLLGNARVLLEVQWGRGWLCCPVPSPNGHSLAWSERAFEYSVTMLENF